MPREPAAGSRLGDFWPTALRWVDENHDANPPTEPPWPTLRVPDGPRAAPPLRNLRNPSTYVVSLAGSHSRRRLFARQWNALEGLPGGFEAVRWLRAVNGSRIPPEVANPAGARARGQEAVFRARPGILGCSLSHMLAFRLHLAADAAANSGGGGRAVPLKRDLVVLEDDALFHQHFGARLRAFLDADALPEYVEHGRRRGEVRKLPVARYHIGGDAFWSAPWSETDLYYDVSWVSRLWAYIIRAEFVAPILDHLTDTALDPGPNPAVDQRLSGSDFTRANFSVLAPKIPLVWIAEGGRSNTDLLRGEVLRQSDQEEKVWLPGAAALDWDGLTKHGKCWQATWTPEQPCVADFRCNLPNGRHCERVRADNGTALRGEVDRRKAAGQRRHSGWGGPKTAGGVGLYR